MHPILIDLGTVDLPIFGSTHLFLPTYGVLFALGTVAAWWWFLRRLRDLGVSQEVGFNLVFYTLLAGLLGAKGSLLIVDWRYYAANPREILGLVRVAGVLLGGVAAGAVAFFLYARSHRLPLLRLGDAVAAPLALAQGVGRLGCFMAGCCWGVPWPGGFCAVTFTDPAAHAQTGVPLDLALVPVQLLQAAADLGLAGILTWMYRRRAPAPGSVASAYLVLYGVARALIETLRGDGARGLWLDGRVSTSQVLGGVAAICGIGLWAAARRRGTSVRS